MSEVIIPLAKVYRSIGSSLELLDDIANHKKLGSLVMGELLNCKKLPTKAAELEKIMLHIAKILEVTVVQSTFHEFSPYGLSGVLVLAESHFSIHTWPEYNAAAVDLFSCKEIHPEKAIDYLKKSFDAESIEWVNFPRGLGIKP
jgi:S-adenosylmethionine decarboxylase proenzyme